MRRIPLVPLLFIIIVDLAAPWLGSPALAAKSKIKTVELLDLVDKFLLPEGYEYANGFWDAGAEKGGPIEWLSDGAEINDEGYFRKGRAVVTINGKYHTVLRKYAEPARWTIVLSGAKCGYFDFSISSPFLPGDSVVKIEDLLRKKGASYKKTAHTGDDVSYAMTRYRAKFPKRKPCWLDYDWSLGSAGKTHAVKVYLDEPNEFGY